MMCLSYLFSAKTARQLVNREADFFTKRIDSNRELECSNRRVVLQVRYARPCAFNYARRRRHTSRNTQQARPHNHF